MTSAAVSYNRLGITLSIYKIKSRIFHQNNNNNNYDNNKNNTLGKKNKQ